MTRHLGKRLSRLEREAGIGNPSRLLWLDEDRVSVLPQGWALERQMDETDDAFEARVAEAKERSRLEAPDCADPLGVMLAHVAANGRRLGG